MIGFGDFDKLMKGAALANKVVTTDPIIDDGQQRYSAPTQNRQRAMPINESANDDLDSLVADINSALGKPLTESATPMKQPAIETPKPRPAVSQGDFVNAAIKAKTAATIDPKKQKVAEQKKADLFPTDEENNAKLAAKGASFKKYLVENIANEENINLIEAVSKIFDIIVMDKK